MAGIAVRLAKVGDAAVLAPLFDAYRGFYGLASDPQLARDYLAQRLGQGDALVLLAHADAEPTATDPAAVGGTRRAAPLGFCQIYPTWGSLLAAPMGVLYDLYVIPAARRRGVGRALLDAAAALARERGLARLELSTATDNLPAQALYESLGWVRGTRFLSYSLRP